LPSKPKPGHWSLNTPPLTLCPFSALSQLSLTLSLLSAPPPLDSYKHSCKDR
jgi:hypothetical protein